jgi:RNA polymerase sigma-70 factor, ECF subfamily
MQALENELKAAVERRYGGIAQLPYVDAVSKTFRTMPAWNGLVFVFDLVGHPRAERAYAWSVPVENRGQHQFHVALHGPLIASAHDAVRAEMGSGSNGSSDLREAMVAAIPRLRAFAISLTNNLDAADDLVQETILRAWIKLDEVEPGTTMKAWLFTILRSAFMRHYRGACCQPQDSKASSAARPPTLPEKAKGDLQDMRTALTKLSVEHREALILIEAESLSYEEAAQVCGVTIGTIQRRVHRAWESLAQLLAVQAVEDVSGGAIVYHLAGCGSGILRADPSRT